MDILVFSSLYFCLPCPFSCSSSSFLLPLFLFKNGQNARDIRQFCSPLPPESPKTLNFTKTMVFYSKSWPPGSKTHAFLILFEGSPRGAQEAPKRSSRGTQDERFPRGPQEAPKRPPGGPRDGLRCKNCWMSHAFLPLLPPSFFIVFYNGFCTFSVNKVSNFSKTAKTRGTFKHFGHLGFLFSVLLSSSPFFMLFLLLPSPSLPLQKRPKR